MENRRNYYRILHVQQDAPLALIKSAYRTMMQKLKMHPDLGGDSGNAALINEAYSVLSNASSRAAYDEAYKRVVRQGPASHKPNKDGSAEAKANPDSDPKRKYQAPKKPSCHFCQADIKGSIVEDSQCWHCTSPLQLTSKSEGDQGQRAIYRMPASHDIEVRLHWPSDAYRGRLVDMSLQGAQFNVAVDLRAEAIVQIKSDYFIAVARITRVIEKYRYATEFISVNFTETQGSFVSVQV